MLFQRLLNEVLISICFRMRIFRFQSESFEFGPRLAKNRRNANEVAE